MSSFKISNVSPKRENETNFDQLQSELSSLQLQNNKPHISGRSVIINRSSGDSFDRGNRFYQSEKISSRISNACNSTLSLVPGTYATMTTNGVGVMLESRDKEKKDLQDLNERLATYVEKVRFLEAQNKSLVAELQKIKQKWGKETSYIKDLYENELKQARQLLDDTVHEKGGLDIKMASLEEMVAHLRDSYNESNESSQKWKEKWESGIKRISEAETEALMMRKIMETMEMERERDRNQIKKLNDLVNNLRQDLDNESYLHLEAATKLQTRDEELAFANTVHHQELEELRSLVTKDSTIDNRKYWKGEMGTALKEIQEMYDKKLEVIKSELEFNYTNKIKDLKTGSMRSSSEVKRSKEEVKRVKESFVHFKNKLLDLDAQNSTLKREINSITTKKEEIERELGEENRKLKEDMVKLRAEMDAILKEVNSLSNLKLSLEMEISAYRKLLESEEIRIDEWQNKIEKAKNMKLHDHWSTKDESSEEPGYHDDRSVSSGYSELSTDQKPFSGFNSSSRGQFGTNNDKNSVFCEKYGKNITDPNFSMEEHHKGPCLITQASLDGKFVAIENTGRREEGLGGWVIERLVNERKVTSFTFDTPFILFPNSSIKIWARNQKPFGANRDLEANVREWGRGSHVVTRLITPSGEERAVLIQKAL